MQGQLGKTTDEATAITWSLDIGRTIWEIFVSNMSVGRAGVLQQSEVQAQKLL
jgi:hypothetical protein